MFKPLSFKLFLGYVISQALTEGEFTQPRISQFEGLCRQITTKANLFHLCLSSLVERPLEDGAVEEGDDALALQLPLDKVAPGLADLEARRAERVASELDLSAA